MNVEDGFASALRGAQGQEGTSQEAASELLADASDAAVPGHRRRPRGREHLVAPARGAQARRCPPTAWCSTRSRSRCHRAGPWPNPAASTSTENLVAPQETRRIVDRLYGYAVSQAAVEARSAPQLSAGRVQSVAVRLVVERERARAGVRARRTWWDVGATFAHADGGLRPADFDAQLVEWGGKRLAEQQGLRRHRQAQAQARRGGPRRAPAPTEARGRPSRPPRPATGVQGRREADPTQDKPGTARSRPARCSRRPTASCAGRPGARCRWRSACTRTAGSPTCGPTRSPRCPTKPSPPRARGSSRTYYGADYLPDSPRLYKQQVQGRPGSPRGHPPRRQPPSARWPRPSSELGGDEARLYEFIWKRTVACQMMNARGKPAERAGVGVQRGCSRPAGTDHRLPGLPPGLRRGVSDNAGGRAGRPREAAAAGQGRRGTLEVVTAPSRKDHATQPPRSSHRGIAGQGAGGPGHRPAVDLRLDHRHHPAPRATCSRRAARWCRPSPPLP